MQVRGSARGILALRSCRRWHHALCQLGAVWYHCVTRVEVKLVPVRGSVSIDLRMVERFRRTMMGVYLGASAGFGRARNDTDIGGDKNDWFWVAPNEFAGEAYGRMMPAAWTQ